MSNFLETLTIPQLGSADFQTEFEAFCSAIKNNFERLVSVQFTKGNDGNSVVAQRILIGAGLTKTDYMPNMVYQIVKSIYKFESDEPMTIGDFKHALEGDHNIFGDTTSGGIAPSFYDAYSFPELQDLTNETETTTGFYVDIVLDEHNKKAYMAVPYIFIDGRISELSRYKREHADDDIYKTFHDYSTSVFGVGTYVEPEEPTEDEIKIVDWNWETDSMDIVPKLYFDDNIGEFCWEVNRQQTGVTAQGVKGNDGIASHIYTAEGTRHDTIIEVDAIQFADDNGNISWLTNKERLDDIKNYINGEEIVIRSVKFSDGTNSVILRDTDFLLVFYREQSDSTTYDKAFLGKPYVDADAESTDVYVYCDETNDIFNTISKQSFREMLNGIYDSDNTADLRGIYIPGRSQIGETANTYHMTYSESSSKMHSAIVDYDGTQGNADSPITQQIGDWQVDYNMQVQGNTSVQGAMYVQGNATMRNNACVQGDLNVQGNIEAESINVTGKPFRSIPDVRPAVVSTFTNTKYKLTRNAAHNNTQPASSTDNPWHYENSTISYNIDFSTILNLKIGLLSHTVNGELPATSINQQMHKMIGRYGGQIDQETGYKYMWYQGAIETTIHNDGKVIADNPIFFNAPKLYDVIEYNIPMNIQTGCTDFILLKHNTFETSSNSQYIPNSTTKAGVDNSNATAGPNCRFLVQGNPYGFSYKSNEGSTNIMSNTDVYVQGTSISAWEGINGPLHKIYSSIPSTYKYTGTLDYKGQTLNYFVDFFICIQEIQNTWGRGNYTTNSTIQLQVIPRGYIEFGGHKVPIHGSIPVENAIPTNAEFTL